MKTLWLTAVRTMIVAAATALLLICDAAVAAASPNPVPVPGDYQPGSGPLHDYCTSPMPNSYLGADFKGACAKHDQCMELHKHDQNYGECHDVFESDLQSICNWAFSSTLDFHRRKSCNTLADGAVAAVRIRN